MYVGLFICKRELIRCMSSFVRPLSVCLSVTFARPSRVIEILGNISMPWYLGHL